MSLIPTIIGMLISIALIAILGGFIIQVVTLGIKRFHLPYKDAYKISFFGSALSSLVTLALFYMVPNMDTNLTTMITKPSVTNYVLLYALDLVFWTIVLGHFLKSPDTGRIGCKAGFLIALLYTSILKLAIYLISLIVTASRS